MQCRSMKSENAAKAIEPDMVLAMAPCTEAVVQCVERRHFQLVLTYIGEMEKL